MSSVKPSLLKRLVQDLVPGVPVSYATLAAKGISAQLAYRYVKTGWLQRLASGVYAAPNHPLSLEASLRFLAEESYPLHVGGKTALAWFGYRHNVSPTGEQLTLYAQGRTKVPKWFTEHFQCRVSGRVLFDEPNGVPLYLANNHPTHPGIWVSEPERAALEMLSDVPENQGLEEASNLVEGMTSMRTSVLMALLTKCKNVKTVRLFLHLAKQLKLPYAASLPPELLPTGSKSRYVRKLPKGTLILKS